MSSHLNELEKYRLTVTYDGRSFIGWQRHGSKPTVQRALEQAVKKTFSVSEVVQGAGRTDRGAHANGQVASVLLPGGFELDDIENQLNDELPAEVRVVEVCKVPRDFHACDSAIGKHYRYVIWNHPQLPLAQDGRVWHAKNKLDVDAMNAACPIFEGEHDFASVATKSNFVQKSTTRTVALAVLTHDLPKITFDIYADGFLYKMVRNIVRTIVKVGEGRYTCDDVRHILKAKNRQAAPGTAPASGLYLERVYYSQDEYLQAIKEGAPS